MTGDAELAGAVRSDADLISAVRSGDTSAFAVLYERHGTAAQSVARQYARSQADAEDITSDAFTKVLAVIAGGGGPDEAFRAYLFTVVRRLAYASAQAVQRVQVTDDVATFESAFGPAGSVEEPALEGFERTVVARAYDALPERWQAVLWYTEIEGMSAAQIAPLLGLSANGVAALTYRAREGLRQGYLQQHLSTAPTKQCAGVVDKLGAYVRGGLSARDTAPVEAHLDGCTECRAIALELGDVNHGMRAIVAPLVLGIAGLAAFPGLGALAGATGAAGAATQLGPDGIADAPGAGGAGAGTPAGSGAGGAVGAGATTGGGGIAALVAGAPLSALVAAAALVVGVVAVSVAAALGAFSTDAPPRTAAAGTEVAELADESRGTTDTPTDPPAPTDPDDDAPDDDAPDGDEDTPGGDGPGTGDGPDGGDGPDDGNEDDGRDDDDGGNDDDGRDDDGGNDDDGRDDDGNEDDGNEDDGRDDDGPGDGPDNPEDPGDGPEKPGDPEDPVEDPEDPDDPTGPPTLGLPADQPTISLAAGDPGSVAFAITNTGPVAASDLIAVLTLPEGVRAAGPGVDRLRALAVRLGATGTASAEAWQCSSTPAAATATCALPDLPAGSTAALELAVDVDQFAPVGETTIDVVITGSGLADVTLTVPVTIEAPSSAGLDLVVPDETVALDRGGEPGYVTVRVQNHSAIELDDVELAVSLPPGVAWIPEGVGDAWSCAPVQSRPAPGEVFAGQVVCTAWSVAGTSSEWLGELGLDLPLVALPEFDGGSVELVASSPTLGGAVTRSITVVPADEAEVPAGPWARVTVRPTQLVDQMVVTTQVEIELEADATLFPAHLVYVEVPEGVTVRPELISAADPCLQVPLVADAVCLGLLDLGSSTRLTFAADVTAESYDAEVAFDGLAINLAAVLAVPPLQAVEILEVTYAPRFPA